MSLADRFIRVLEKIILPIIDEVMCEVFEGIRFNYVEGFEENIGTHQTLQ